MNEFSPPSNLGRLFGKDKGKKSTVYSPFSAVKHIDSELSKREYAKNTIIELLGLQEKFIERLSWQQLNNKPTPDSDKRSLESIQRELKLPSRQMERINLGDEYTKRNKWRTLYPDEGPYRRELYPKHLDCYRQGKTSNERLLLGANRSGKTICGAYETTCHVTGIYPSWWEGHRFVEPIMGWVCNKGAKECRDINEAELLGPTGNLSLRGTGMIPAHRIIKCTPKSGTPNAVEFIDVEHVSGGVSRIQSKSFDQGREAFQGTAIPWIWDDEECPEDVYGEQVMRTMTVGGLILCTYTPILGLTPLTTEFLHAAGIEIEGNPIKQEQVNG